MTKEYDNFIIESDIYIDYFDDIVDYIIENEKRILTFFELDKLPHKIRIKILSYEPFKEFIIFKYGEILDYISGDSDSKTNTIRILNVEDQIRYTVHKNADVEAVKKTALHEFVHQCHQTYHTDYRQTSWFAEGLATNIANQDRNLQQLDGCDFNQLKNNFRYYKGNYNFAYTIVKYILNNYKEAEIHRLYKDPDYLRKKADSIFEEARVWVNKNTK